MSTTPNLGLFKHDNPSKNTNKFDVEKALNKNWDIVDEKHGDLQAEQEIIQAEQLTQNTNINNNTTNIEELTQRVGDNETHIENIKQKQTIQDNKLSELETGLEENFYNKTELDKLLTAKASQNDLESLQERVSTNETDITNIEEEQVDQNTNIENLQTENQELKEKLAEVEEDNEKLRKVFPSVKGEGSEITLNGTTECKMDIKVKGNTEQEQYSGKQLLDLDNPVQQTDNIKIDDEGWITLEIDNTNGSTQVWGNFYPRKNNNLKPNTTYTIFFELKEFNNSSNVGMYITGAYAETQKPTTVFKNETRISGIEFEKGKIYRYTNETIEDLNLENVECIIRNAVGCSVGEKINMTYRISIFEGDIPLDDFVYEPYTGGEPAPNPNFIIPIENCGDIINLSDVTKIQNQNIVIRDNGKTIVMPLITSGNGYTSTGLKLKELCPSLKNGDEVYLNAKSTAIAINNQIWLSGVNSSWYFGSKRTITEEDLNSLVIMYGNRYSDGDTTQVTISDFVIAAENTTDWSPYGCGSIDIKKQNKNWFNTLNVYSGAEFIKQIIDNNNFILNYEGTESWKKTGFKVNLKKNTDYSFQFKQTNTKQDILNFILIKGYKEGQANTIYSSQYNNLDIIHLNSGNYDYFEFIFHVTQSATTAGNNIATIENVKLYEGTFTKETMPEYEEYQEQNYPFTLEKGQRLHKDDYLADDEIVNTRKHVELDGTENIGLQNDCFTFSEFNDIQSTDTSNKIIVISSHYPGVLTNYRDEIAKLDYGISKVIGDNKQIAIRDERFKTVDEFKGYLSEQKEKGTPVIIEYILQDEIITPYTEIQQKQYNSIKKAMSYAGGTHITATSENANPILEVEAVADMSSVINNFDTRLLALESEV